MLRRATVMMKVDISADLFAAVVFGGGFDRR
jgi:hypothetical protein